MEAPQGEQAGPIETFLASLTLEVPAPFGASQSDSLFLLGGEILTLDPALERGSPGGITGALFSGLARFDSDLVLTPDLARDWTVSEDRTVYTFNTGLESRIQTLWEIRITD